MQGSPLTVVDLFCGAGGLSHGFMSAGCTILLGTDFNETAGKTFDSSHNGARFLNGDLSKMSASHVRQSAGVGRSQLDVMVGSPPCQGFSINNPNRGLHDPRTSLYMDYLRIVEDLRPRWIVMENVTGMLSLEKGRAVGEIVGGLKKLGYSVEMGVLKAEEYGVPQERRRLVFIGNRIGAPVAFPLATHGQGLEPYVNVRQAIYDLPLESPREDVAVAYRTRALSTYQTAMRGGRKTVDNHWGSSLSGTNMDRLKHIPQGGSWREIPFELLPAGMKTAKRSDHTKRYGRLSPDGLASTILTKCDIHWGAYIHPEVDRGLTVREAARLQSFPDSVVFHGTRGEQYMQIGNAVPPVLGAAIAQAIRHSESCLDRSA